MTDHIKKEAYDREMDFLGKIYNGFLLGIGSIMGIWFLSGLLYVILK